MSLRDSIKQAQIAAMKDRDSKRVAVLRMAESAIKNAQIDAMKELDDAGVVAVIQKQVKQLRDALMDFEKAGREDLIEQSQYEIGVLEAYLPVQLSDMELDAIIKEVIAEVHASSPSDIGKVMGPIMAKVQGKADGARVRSRLTALLS